MTIKLIDAFFKGIIKTGDYIKYNPDCQKYMLSELETGFVKRQILKTEDFKYQFAGMVCGKLTLVADGVTKPMIKIGIQGYNEWPKAIKKGMQTCYSSKKLGAKGECLTEPIFEKLPEQLKRKAYNYCLGTSYFYLRDGTFGIREVKQGLVWTHILYSSTGYDGDFSDNGVRPIIILPLDIQIDKDYNLVK